MRVDIRGKAFDGQPVLGPIAFEIGVAEAVALTGPSGIGKSTLLRIIAGLDRDFDGKITGAGRLAMVFQEPTLMPWRSARDNIVLAADVSAPEADALLASVGLADKAGLFPTQLSLGQRRRVAIVRAFARRPETLLMDEPFTSLDAESSRGMQELLRGLLSERPTRLILVTHDPRDAEALATRRIHLDGAPARVMDQSAVKN